MNKPIQPNSADCTWQLLASAARQAPSDAPVALDPDQVLQQVAAALSVQSASADRSQERLVPWVAALAVAASLLLTFVCWSDVVAAWSPEPAIFELPVPLELAE